VLLKRRIIDFPDRLEGCDQSSGRGRGGIAEHGRMPATVSNTGRRQLR
jgi:hypothetical protein